MNNLTNVKPVTSFSAKQEMSGLMGGPTLVERLTNAKPVKSVLAHQEHWTDMEDPTQITSLTNTSYI